MRVLIASDSFKGSLSSQKAGEAIAEGLQMVYRTASFKIIPIADGGEGTAEALVKTSGGKYLTSFVTGPLAGKKVEARIGMLPDETAVVETAAASGLVLLKKEQRNPLVTTTMGTGELVKIALDSGAKKIILGIGGSATNDGGAGFAKALGVKFLNKEGRELMPGGQDLINLHKIELDGLDKRLKNIEITVFRDVDNPLCGPRGASTVFGPQKGATPDMAAKLDESLEHFAKVIKEELRIDIKDIPGAGAAGGLGGGLMAFTGAAVKSGIEAVLDFVNFDEELKECNLVITGEGRVDSQSAYGKAVRGVGLRAKKQGKPVIVVAGSVGPGADVLYDCGVSAVFPVVTLPVDKVDIDYAVENAFELISKTAEKIFRVMKLGQKLS